jgi:hypothetical protein
MRVYNSALEQTRDNLKTLTKTNTDYIKSVNRHNKEVNTTTTTTSH